MYYGQHLSFEITSTPLTLMIQGTTSWLYWCVWHKPLVMASDDLLKYQLAQLKVLRGMEDSIAACHVGDRGF